MNYTPNFTDPRVISRCIKAINFCERFLKENKDGWLSSRWIDQHLGSNSRPLSRYLRDQLLICTNEEYNRFSKITKRYRLNKDGLELLKVDIKYSKQIHYSVAVLQINSKLQTQLTTKQFEFNDTSSRLYNPLQNLPRAQKKEIFESNNLKHNYDIVCACPQLFLQKAQQMGMDLYLFAINDYIKNKRSIRERIAKECEIDIQTVKVLINAIFQGAYISKYSKSSIYRLLNGDIGKIEWLKQDQFLIDLRSDIKEIWTYLGKLCTRRTKKDQQGRDRLLPIRAKQKTAVYRHLERTILNEVIDYAKIKQIDLFPEHDGWRTNEQLDLIELRTRIRSNTGFDIDIEYDGLANI